MGVAASTSGTSDTHHQEGDKPRRRPSLKLPLPELKRPSATDDDAVENVRNGVGEEEGNKTANFPMTSNSPSSKTTAARSTVRTDGASPPGSNDGSKSRRRRSYLKSLLASSSRSRATSSETDTTGVSMATAAAAAAAEADESDSDGINLSIPFEAISGPSGLADGTCCRCLRGTLGRKEVVLKTLKPESSVHDGEDLDKELNILQLLRNKHVVKLYGAGQMPQGGMFIAMEYLSRGTVASCLGTDCAEGTTWFWKLRLRSWFPREEALRQAAGVAGALSYMHNDAMPGAKIVHRDIKASNLAFAADGTVKLFDFGLAKILRLHDLAGDNVYKMTGNTGSLRYMPPEVAQRLPANETADVYSFSLVIWEMIMLEQPFSYYDPTGMWDQVIYGTTRPRIPSDWPEGLGDLLTSCWAADMKKRPGMKEVEQRLRVLAKPAAPS